MGMYRYITAEETAKMKQVSDPELNELLQEALEIFDALLIEEVLHKLKRNWLFRSVPKTEYIYNIYIESNAHDGSPYQAMYIYSRVKDKKTVSAYLYGIITGGHALSRKICSTK